MFHHPADGFGLLVARRVRPGHPCLGAPAPHHSFHPEGTIKVNNADVPAGTTGQRRVLGVQERE